MIPGRILGAGWRATFQKYYSYRGGRLRACGYVYNKLDGLYITQQIGLEGFSLLLSRKNTNRWPSNAMHNIFRAILYILLK